MDKETQDLLLFEGFIEACKFIRENPPGHLPEEDTETFVSLSMNYDIDPEGLDFMEYFIAKAQRRLVKEGRLKK